MNTFLGFSRQCVEKYFNRTHNAVFLHHKRIKHEVDKSEGEAADTKKPTRLAIGVEGGFSVEDDKKYNVEEQFGIVVMPGFAEIPLDSPDIPDHIRASAAMIIAADSAAKQAELEALAGTWDGEARIVSKHALSLEQLNNGVKVAPTGWKCAHCDLRENLWMNLTDGAILCGRTMWGGKGGNNHAVEHYQKTGRPLAVKLGTITPEGGDVYSYDEDDMVVDPLLSKHLAHFGIDIMKMEKTEQTMAEMELDLNQKAEWLKLSESGTPLQPVYGPGYTGLQNLGNSCYMNSVMQVIMTLKPFLDKYYTPAQRIFDENTTNPIGDFNVQMAKLARGLASGDYSKAPSSDKEVSKALTSQGIRPHMFKLLIGQGNPEFSTKRQQDAQEYLLHLFNIIERNSRGSVDPLSGLRFRVEDRIECTGSHKVKYLYRDEYCLTLRIPLEAASNREQFEAYLKKKESLDAQGLQLDATEVVKPRVSLYACLSAFASPSIVEDFYSSALKTRTTAKKTTRFGSFPDHLFIHMQKFSVGTDWVERKLDVSLDMPDEIDISNLRGLGKQPGEEELPEETAPAAAPAVVMNESFVSQLIDMGFPLEACKRAVYSTNNTGVEAALNWAMEHVGDPDFSDPFVVPQAAPGAGQSDEFMADEGSLATIMSLGFTHKQALQALKATDNNVERAADWIFSHADEIGQSDEPMDSGSAATAGQQQQQYVDGSSKYRLVAFISHMGTSTKAGHYVCHIRKQGRWVIFNDEKVSLSEQPPQDLAYLYLYERI